ncbi:MAG: L-threonylcarbamoyladenylate synthase, partial [Elusimicrobiota bacterium]|nr:L-threonylcarbamoyladenylate synthase [Elusimicrobiota bacterium]
IVTAKLNTVAIRMPSCPVALSLIRESQTSIAAPSANIFSTPSATTAKHVIEDLDGKIDVIIDNGKTKIGVESTVVDFSYTSHYLPKILRPGAITYEMLRKFLGRNIAESDTNERRDGRDIITECEVYRSPGMMPRHYSPKARLILADTVSEMVRIAMKFQSDGKQVGILTFSENKDKFKGVDGFNLKILGSKADLKTCAKNLFSLLREFDTDGIDVIIAQKIKKVHLGRAIMDRLEKAAGKGVG